MNLRWSRGTTLPLWALPALDHALNLVGCLDLPTSGQYILKDQDMSTLNDNQLAEIRNQHIGFVFQNFYLLPKMTAWTMWLCLCFTPV